MKFIKRRNLIKLRKMRKRKSKTHFINNKNSVFSQVKKDESPLERIRGYQGEIQIHLGKMEVRQIERTKKKKNAVEWKPIKFQKKKSKKRRRKAR